MTLDSGEETVEIQIFKEPNYINTLDKSSCIKFGKALGDFKNQIMDPALGNDLTPNEILLKV